MSVCISKAKYLEINQFGNQCCELPLVTLINAQKSVANSFPAVVISKAFKKPF